MWRGARISIAPGTDVRTRLNALSTAPSSPFIVLPATMTGGSEGCGNIAGHDPSLASEASGYQVERVELQAAGHGDATRVGAQIDEPAR